MDKISIVKTIKESRTENNIYSIYTTVKVNDIELEDILDVHEFFLSLNSEGYLPLFTCECGVFGCGGYYIFIEHTNDLWKMKNSFYPEENCEDYEIKDKFEYEISWRNIREVGKELIEFIEKFIGENPNCALYPGQLGMDLTKNIDEYKIILSGIKG